MFSEASRKKCHWTSSEERNWRGVETGRPEKRPSEDDRDNRVSSCGERTLVTWDPFPIRSESQIKAYLFSDQPSLTRRYEWLLLIINSATDENKFTVSFAIDRSSRRIESEMGSAQPWSELRDCRVRIIN